MTAPFMVKVFILSFIIGVIGYHLWRLHVEGGEQ